VKLTHIPFIGLMITKLSKYSQHNLQFLSVQDFIFPWLSTHCYSKHNYKMTSRNSCIPFCKHCDFLEGIACLRHGMTFFWCCCRFAEHLLQSCFQIRCHPEIRQSLSVWRIEFFCVDQCVPLDTGCRSIPYLHSTKSICCRPGGARFCLLGVPSLQ